MIILKIILYFIAIYGLSFMMVYQNGPFNLFSHIRNISKGLKDLLSCMFCTPTWLGMFASLLNITIFQTTPFTVGFLIFGSITYWPLIIMFDILITPVVVHFIDLIENIISNKANE